jgi:hypothetical protein
MRKMASLTAVLLLSSAWMLGQGTAQAGSSNSSQTNSNANEVTIEGCLSGSAGNYTLTDNSGMSYQLQGETSKLSDQVGRQVQIKGTQTASASATTPSGDTASTDSSGSNAPSSTANKPSGSAAGSSATASAAIQFNVSSVEKLSDSCKASSTKK